MNDYRKAHCIHCEIKIREHLEPRWKEWFEGLSFTYGDDETTTLSGSLPDQTSLHTILVKIRDMNLTLISVNQSEINTEETSGDNEHGT